MTNVIDQMSGLRGQRRREAVLELLKLLKDPASDPSAIADAQEAAGVSDVMVRTIVDTLQTVRDAQAAQQQANELAQWNQELNAQLPPIDAAIQEIELKHRQAAAAETAPLEQRRKGITDRIRHLPDRRGLTRQMHTAESARDNFPWLFADDVDNPLLNGSEHYAATIKAANRQIERAHHAPSTQERERLIEEAERSIRTARLRMEQANLAGF